MTNLIIFTDTMTAIEIYCGDDIKYVESFANWCDLLSAVGSHIHEYAWIEIKSESPKSGLFSRA